jgi:hypothetical protein
VTFNRQPLRYADFSWQKLNCLGVPGGSSRKLGAAKVVSGGLQQLGYMASLKPRENLTKACKRPRSEGSTSIKEANPSKRPRNLIALILKDNYSEDKLLEEQQDLILAAAVAAFITTPRERIPWLRSYRLEGGKLTFVLPNNHALA